MPIYQEPNAGMTFARHKIWPYPLKGMVIERSNQVLLSAMRASPAGQRVCRHHLHPDASGLSVPGGDLSPCSVMHSMIPSRMDWATWKVLRWRLSNIERLVRHWTE